MVTVSLVTGEVMSGVMVDALIGCMSPTNYAFTTFRAVDRAVKLGAQIPADSGFHAVEHRGITFEGQRSFGDAGYRLVMSTPGDVFRELMVRFSPRMPQTPERLKVDMLAATKRGAVRESHVFGFASQSVETGSPLLEVRDGNVDLKKAKAYINDPTTTASFTRGIPVVEIPCSGFSEIFLKRVFPRLVSQGETAPLLVLGLTLYAAEQLFNCNTNENLILDLKSGTENHFHTNDLKAVLEVLGNPDEASEFDSETLRAAGALLYLLKTLGSEDLTVLRKGMTLLEQPDDVEQVLDAAQKLVDDKTVEKLSDAINQKASKLEAQELTEKMGQFMEDGAAFTVSVGLPSHPSRVNVTVTGNNISIAVYFAPNQEATKSIDVPRYHQKFLSPLVRHILGSEPGPIGLVRALAGRQRRKKKGRPKLVLFSGGRSLGEE